MIKISKASKENKARGIVMFWSNKITVQELSKIGSPLSEPLRDEEKEIEDGFESEMNQMVDTSSILNRNAKSYLCRK